LLDALINLAGILIARKKLIAAEEQAHRAKMYRQFRSLSAANNILGSLKVKMNLIMAL